MIRLVQPLGKSPDKRAAMEEPEVLNVKRQKTNGDSISEVDEDEWR